LCTGDGLLGSLILLIGIAIAIADLGKILALKLAPSPLTLSGMHVMFVGSGAIPLVLGVLVLATSSFVIKSK